VSDKKEETFAPPVSATQKRETGLIDALDRRIAVLESPFSLVAEPSGACADASALQERAMSTGSER
jgi:hypothetical protein